MAKELTLATIDKLHSGLEGEHPNLVDVEFIEIRAYYQAGDFCNFIYDTDLTTFDEGDKNIFTLILLILAAEDELEGYLR